MSEQTKEHSTADGQHEKHDHHVGYGTYVMVWFGLIALTSITVSVSGINLGSVTLITAMVIATVKSILVINYFMHVKFDNFVIKLFILVCLFVIAVISVLTFSDLSYR